MYVRFEGGAQTKENARGTRMVRPRGEPFVALRTSLVDRSERSGCTPLQEIEAPAVALVELLRSGD